MTILGSIPVLASKNVHNAVVFYQQAFQFVMVNQRIDSSVMPEKIRWAHLKSSHTALMLEAVDNNIQQVCCSRLYFYTDEINSLHHYLIAKGYHPEHLYNTDYRMREFTIFDPDGHQLTIGQRLSL